MENFEKEQELVQKKKKNWKKLLNEWERGVGDMKMPKQSQG